MIILTELAYSALTNCFSNIDVRIQQAELEYQLGREELNLLTLLEETRTLQACLDESNKNSNDGHTLYRYVDYRLLLYCLHKASSFDFPVCFGCC